MLKAPPAPLRAIVLTPGMGGMGGISRLVDTLAAELADRPVDGLDVHYVSTRGDILLLRPLVFVLALARVLGLCVAGRCDVLHISLASFGSTYRKLCFATIAWATGTPYIVHLHGGQYKEFWSSRPVWMRRLIDALFRRADRVLVLGQIWADLVRTHVPDAASRIIVMPNAVSAPASRPRSRDAQHAPTILFLGRLTPAKGVATLIEALAGLPGSLHWKAVLAGDGDVGGTRALVQSHGISDRVRLPGWVDKPGTDELWRNADIFVLPSLIENMPLSIIEAFSYEVPVICTGVGAIPEMVTDAVTGLMVPVSDPAALRAAMMRLLSEPRLREELAARAYRQYLDRFEMSGYAGRLVSLWRDVASTRGHSDKHAVGVA